MRTPQGWEWLLIVALILLLFGAKRLPDAARGLGRSLRIFKAETKGLTDSDTSIQTSAEDVSQLEANSSVEVLAVEADEQKK